MSKVPSKNPSRGARGLGRGGDAGFTLIELLVVLGIIVLLATIAAPQVLRYLGKARTETARAQISSLSTALELYSLDVGGFPAQQTGLQALMQNSAGSNRWKGPYLKRADGSDRSLGPALSLSLSRKGWTTGSVLAGSRQRAGRRRRGSGRRELVSPLTFGF